MRWVICGCAVYIAYQRYQEKKSWNAASLIFSAVAVLYNPINTIHLFKEAWIVLNIVTAILFTINWWVNASELEKSIFKKLNGKKYF